MEYSINLGAWSSVFAVPCDVVDKHIKLAGAAQLKVLLWILRNAGTNFLPEDISKALSMHVADVKDSIQFWEAAGLICIYDNNINPSPKNLAKKSLPAAISSLEESKKAPRVPPRPQRPDSLFVSQRMNEDENIANLMQEAEIVLCRPLSGGDTSTLLMLHDNDGLPVTVILMLLQYAMGEGKANMRYIEKVGINWGIEEIFTVERAEEKIEELRKKKNSWEVVKKTFGLNLVGSPTKSQLEYANRWINEYKISIDLIREAYEICIDTKGQYNIKYINGILEKWHNEGVATLTDAETAQKKFNETTSVTKKVTPNKQKKKEQWQNTSFDINDIEGKDIFSDK